MNTSVQAHESDEADRIFGRRIRPCGLPLDLLEVGGDERDVARRAEIEERRAREQGRIQPQRMVCDQVVDTGRAEEVATGGSASDTARGEHEMRQPMRPI
jgi:hypothetical protein